MKIALSFLIIILSGCCPKYYDESYPIVPFTFNINYTGSGLSNSDTTFNVTVYGYSAQNTYITTAFVTKQSKDQGYFNVYNIDNTEKILFESTRSNFKDSLINIGYQTKKVLLGSKRCGNYSTHFFNIHGTYKGNILNSSESSTLEINVTK